MGSIGIQVGRRRWGVCARLMRADMEKIPGKLQKHFVDYKVDIIHMRSIPKEDLQKMDTDLKYVLWIMKCTGSRKKYVEYIRKNKEYFSKIPRSAERYR